MQMSSSRKTSTVVLTAALLALASPMAATAATAGHSASRHSYNKDVLRQDLARVREAGGGDVNVLARVDGPHGAPLMARIGTRTADSSDPIPWNAHFRTASTTKAFTATVVLQLVAEKRLSLDDTVEHWLPGSSRATTTTAAASPSATCCARPAACTTTSTTRRSRTG